MVTTDGHLLGGRVIYRQPAAGFRSGIEPVLLAASIPARGGDHVLEAGTGAAAALLCLHARVPGISATGVEAIAEMACLASANAVANRFVNLNVRADRLETAVFPHLFDHVLANPPYHTQGGSLSPDETKEAAKRGDDRLIEGWLFRLGGLLRDRGSLTLIVPAGRVPVCLTAMAACRCPCSAIFPLWPKAGRPAKLVLLRGIRNGRAAMQLRSGLVLHEPDGAFTPAAQAVLRDAVPLRLDA